MKPAATQAAADAAKAVPATIPTAEAKAVGGRTLYHLISDQVWQNLIPLLALRPQRVVQVRSNSKRYQTGAKRLARAVAARLPDWQPEWIDAPIDAAFPTIAQTGAHLEVCHQRWPADVVNFTGGTKLMSIAAHGFAAAQGIPSLYYDTQFPEPFDGGTGTLPPMANLQQAIAVIDVRMALIAHGLDQVKLCATTPEPRWLEFASAAATIRATARLPVNRWLEACRQSLSKPGGSGGWNRADGRPLPNIEQTAVLDYADAAVGAGLLRADAGGRLFLAQPAERNFQLLEGGWWELVCLQFLQNQPSYQDTLWSVHIEGNDAEGETDLIAFNRKYLRLELFSCKSGRVEHPLEHVESLRNRTTRLGGTHAAANLMVYQFTDTRQRETFQQHCQRHRVLLWEGPIPQLLNPPKEER